MQDFPSMPRPQNDWGCHRGNQFIFEQRTYNRDEQQEHVDGGLPTLNPQQLAFYDAVMNSVLNSLRSSFILHSGGGCEKTYLAKLISAGVFAGDKIVLGVASTGLAAFLLLSSWTTHLHFKIPIPCHEQRTCSIKKNDTTHQLLKKTSPIIWDEMRLPLSIILLWRLWTTPFMTY